MVASSFLSRLWSFFGAGKDVSDAADDAALAGSQPPEVA